MLLRVSKSANRSDCSVVHCRFATASEDWNPYALTSRSLAITDIVQELPDRFVLLGTVNKRPNATTQYWSIWVYNDG